MIKINAWLHSSQKDHKAMTGGTLTADKQIDSEGQPLEIHTYALHLFGEPDEKEYDSFHAGMHTNEHLLAYTPDTGSLRASLKDIMPDLDTKMILDVSPFETETGYGFRITSLVELDAETLKSATRGSVNKAIAYLDQVKSGNGDPKWFKGIPFATAEQCGQFTFHDPEHAQKSLQWVTIDSMKIESNTQTTNHNKAFVGDLRLLKPKTDETDDRITLDPKFSYHISQLIEAELPKKMPGTAVVVGTFGCMTGTYLCVSCLDGWDEDITLIHKNIMDILRGIDLENLSDNHREQLKTILENYDMYGK